MAWHHPFPVDLPLKESHLYSYYVSDVLSEMKQGIEEDKD